MMTIQLKVRNTVAPLLVLGIGLASTACGSPPSTMSDEQPVGSTEQSVVIPDPNGVYFANVTANGTGCPAGSWEVNIDPLGETFTLTFSKYETSLTPGTRISVKDCQLAIKLHSPQGLSYSISSFFYSGYAYLDSAGMSGRQTAKYYFQGNPIEGVEARTDLTGPFDDDYVYQDDVPVPDLVWSPCGADRMLNISTRILTTNNTGKTGSAYMNTLAVDGSVRLQFRLAWRTCP